LLEGSWLRHIVPTQLKNSHPGRHRDEERHEGEERQQDRTSGEHVVRPHRHRQPGDGDGGRHQALVREAGLAAEHRSGTSVAIPKNGTPRYRPRMPEEPEQVLPEHRPAVAELNTCAPSLRSISSTSSAAASTGNAMSTIMLSEQDVPGEDRHPEQVMPARACIDRGN
jgi:hypothetical protein